jgi:lipopolysaccharide export system protein LptA
MKRFALFFIILLIPSFALSDAKPAIVRGAEQIKIISNELTVYKKEQKGVFTGKVKVTQGDMVLHSDILVVYYTNFTGTKDSAELINQNKISLIEALGNVMITTPSEKAKGDKGIYDVNKGTFTLTGKVILKKGKNVLSGTKFSYNRLSGKGILTSDGNKASKKRTKALFIPE